MENKSRNLQPTHICRAKLGQVSIIPGELFNETCYISGNPTLANGGTGVRAFTENYEILLKMEDVLYDWIEFDGNKGTVPRGALIGGIGSHYEPILVCFK